MNEKREGDVLMCNTELETGHLDQGKPKDKCRFVYFIFFFIGVGTLLPWNFFITATQYFQYQFRNRSLPEGVDPLSPMYRTELQKVFFSYLTIASLIPTTLASFVNLMIKDCLPVFFRVITSAVVMLCMFIITTILTRVVTETNVFFIITLVTVVINNIGSAINQGSIYGLFPVLPGCNSRAFLEGQAVAGIIAAAANLLTIASASNPLDVGFAYFIIGVCIIALTIGLFIILFRNPYFLYYWKNKGIKQRTDNTPWNVKLRRTAANLWHAMWEVRWTGFTLLFTLAVTLAVFPSVYVLLVPNNFDENSQWHTKYFHAVTVFLCYNVFDYVGRMFVGWIKWPKFAQKKLLLSMAVLRAILIPLSTLCNINSKRIPTVFYHDSIPTILVGLLGLTNGYLISLSVNYAPRYASPGNEEGCGIATSTYISLGLCIGVFLSYGIVALV